MVAPRDLCPDLPAEVEAIVLKAVSLNKEERFRSVRELRDALARVLTPLPAPPMNGARVPRPVSSRPSAVFLDTRQEEQAEQPRAGERRSRGAALTVAVAALVFAASLVPFWGWKHLRAPAPLLSVEQSSTAPASRETVNKRNLPASEKEGSPPDTIHPPRVQAGQNPRITPKHPRPRQAPSGTVATPASNTPGAVPRPRPIGHERPADYPTASEAGPPPKAPPESTAPKAPPESTAAKAPPESTDSKPATRPSAEQSTASPPPESSPMLGGAVPPALRTPPAETPKGL